jgi:hypothetical protein
MYILKTTFTNGLILSTTENASDEKIHTVLFECSPNLGKEYLHLIALWQEYKKKNSKENPKAIGEKYKFRFFSNGHYIFFIKFYILCKGIIESSLDAKIKSQLIENLKFDYDDTLADYLRLLNEPKDEDFLKTNPQIANMVNYIKNNIKIEDLKLSNTQQSLEVSCNIEYASSPQEVFTYKTKKEIEALGGLMKIRPYNRDFNGYEKYKYLHLYSFIPNCKDINKGIQIIASGIFEDSIPTYGKIVKIDNKNIKIHYNGKNLLMANNISLSEYIQNEYKNLGGEFIPDEQPSFTELPKKDSAINYKLIGSVLVVGACLFLINQREKILPIFQPSHNAPESEDINLSSKI